MHTLDDSIYQSLSVGDSAVISFQLVSEALMLPSPFQTVLFYTKHLWLQAFFGNKFLLRVRVHPATCTFLWDLKGLAWWGWWSSNPRVLLLVSLPWQWGRLLNLWSTLRQPCRKTVGIQIRRKSTHGRVGSERWVGQIVRAKPTLDRILSALLFHSVFLLLLPECLLTCFFSYLITFFTLKPRRMIVSRVKEEKMPPL